MHCLLAGCWMVVEKFCASVVVVASSYSWLRFHFATNYFCLHLEGLLIRCVSCLCLFFRPIACIAFTRSALSPSTPTTSTGSGCCSEGQTPSVEQSRTPKPTLPLLLPRPLQTNTHSRSSSLPWCSGSKATCFARLEMPQCARQRPTYRNSERLCHRTPSLYLGSKQRRTATRVTIKKKAAKKPGMAKRPPEPGTMRQPCAVQLLQAVPRLFNPTL